MLKISMYEERDFPGLCTIFLRSVKETTSTDYYPRQIAAWAQVDENCWRQKIAASRVLVAINDAPPVGFITVVDDDIDLLFVFPDHSRQGVASALLNTLLRQFPERVYTVAASMTAKPFFARHGFRVIKPQETEARGERFLNYRMRRQIGLQ
ncbi:MAG TPA: GNAT family N-acetyltransferase [Klebsiella sp.]|jgi:putative acetyltransferase